MERLGGAAVGTDLMKLPKLLGVVCALTCILAIAVPSTPGGEQVILRVVPQSDLKIVDPIWTPAYITRNYGYMVYDTLFATDAAGEIRPQMAEGDEVSADGLIHTIRLREGLLWHDGKPVTAEDCVASIKRWAAKDSMGQMLMSFVKDLVVIDQRTFRIVLNEPTGLVLQALGKPSSFVPFMMPKHVAETPPDEQITDFTGSGPFVFKRDEWKPGDKAVYVRFARYKPRPEPPSGLAGGKVVKVDRVEWRAIADPQTAINALLNDEIDLIQTPPHDLLPLLRNDPNVKIVNWNPWGGQLEFRYNTLHWPFNNVKIRQSLWFAFNQHDFLQADVGDPAYYTVCKSIFPCGTPLASTRGTDGLLESNFEKARALLKEGGYDGTPIVLLHATDNSPNLAPVAKSLMEKAGFKVDMQDMDWATLVVRRTKKDPPAQGGWHAFFTGQTGVDILNPITNGFLNASCDKAPFGWPCDEEMEKLRQQYAREIDPGKLKAIAEAVQLRAIQYSMFIPLGQYVLPSAIRKNVDGLLTAPVPVFWNIEKRSP